MSRQNVIERKIPRIRGRSFRFSKCFHRKKRRFQCFVCEGTGYKGYAIKDSDGQILVGERCLRDNFLITVG